jgi:uncharacterized protein (TIGR02996 family)
MDRAAELVAQVAAAPDDDAPRLVYADWLIERGDPLGELIQLQCRLAAEPDDANRRAMRIAENKLLAAHRAAWIEPLLALLPKPHDFDRYKLEHVRGFVERAELTLACMPHMGELVARAPLVRELELHAGFTQVSSKLVPPSIAGVFADRGFERLTALELSLAGGGNAVAREVARAPALANLTRLSIKASVWGELAEQFSATPGELVLDDAGAIALARSPHLAKLRRLSIEMNRLSLAGVHAIAHGAWQLEALELGHNDLDHEGLAGALDGPALASLRELSLRGTWVTAAEIAKLAMQLPALVELDLESCTLGKTGISALCDAMANGGLPALRRLRIERNSIGDAGALAIASCAGLANLRELEAGHNRIGQKGGTALATSPHLSKLERLTLNEPRWKPEMTQLFAGSATLAAARIYLAGKLVARPKRPRNDIR